ncbi:MAG: ABC transporter permease [Lachnospiraceae bacterium]|nr:ABC transporter permease [Lachnospiraceae bacterium]
MDRRMAAIIKKDLRGILANRQMLCTLLAVPAVMTIILPAVFLSILHFAPEEMGDLEKLLEMLPLAEQDKDVQINMIRLILNYILPVFFLMIPIMSSSVMAAASFAGEKEKRTLETLLYSPLSVKQIFTAKVAASFFLSMSVSSVSFFAMLAVLETGARLTAGSFIMPDRKWLLVLLLISPSISLIAITLTVRISAKAKSVEAAQQGAVFLLLPVILLLVGQFTGVLLVGTWLLCAVGALCAGMALWLLKRSMKGFRYETLLKP